MGRRDMEGQEEEGVLLYYKFTSIPDREAAKSWFLSLCTNLCLVGRIRVAPDGVSVTVGGKMVALQAHVEAVSANPRFEGTDFKLAYCTNPVDEEKARQCGFDSLSVRVVKELVTLGMLSSKPEISISQAGEHLSPEQFHRVLKDAGERCMATEPTTPSSGVVMVDARNIYETRIGKFCPPTGVQCLDPGVRQYSDLPKWIDRNEDNLRNKRILMYCTGGVRCEMASAYIRCKGEGFQDVLQLSGGIQRYLEAFPRGGFFKGKNFVFDHRISVPSLDSGVVGSCLLCSVSFDDYSARVRCSLCRMLVLVCDDCRKEGKSGSGYVCELCQSLDGVTKALATADEMPDEAEVSAFTVAVGCIAQSPKSLRSQKLRILCLHGFRQSASTFKGRTAAFRKKLKGVADFVFIDAPHELPYVRAMVERSEEAGASLENLPVQGRKYAWLVTPETLQASKHLERCSMLEGPFDPLQYKTQTAGWAESWLSLQNVFAEQGPFDGVLGFSQGAAVAAALCAARRTDPLKLVDFKFVICCSGFLSPAPEHVLAMPSGELVDCPSLHIYGGTVGHDRQITPAESQQLVSMFEPGSAVSIRHEFGHLIPSKRNYIQAYLQFFNKF